MNEPIAVTLLVTSILESLEIRYLIGGSFASTAYGRVRTTQDVDIIAALTQRNVDAFILALDAAFYVDEAMIREAISRRASFNIEGMGFARYVLLLGHYFSHLMILDILFCCWLGATSIIVIGQESGCLQKVPIHN